MDKPCLHSYIKTRLLLGLIATQTHNELTTAYEQDVVSCRTHRRIRSKQELKAWVTPEESPLTEVRQKLFEEKTMFIMFFMTNGPLLIHQVPAGTPINAIYYCDECLKTIVKKLDKKRASSTANHVKLHHDNAPLHMNNILVNYLQEEKIKIMAHPSYSPHLAPPDF
ncbi:unnamed protein product [Rotaria sordida]|uniref:Transposase n=1 Tax=Rotaria sordida TaxID=392033 RepID=A0A819Y749_9BILA|nr:unnamed protein product [Rotaria sordida]CAF4153867.1 unnamed protein product [Rotaria sordida]